MIGYVWLLNDAEWSRTIFYVIKRDYLQMCHPPNWLQRCRPMEIEGVLLLAVQASGIKICKETQYGVFMLSKKTSTAISMYQGIPEFNELENHHF